MSQKSRWRVYANKVIHQAMREADEQGMDDKQRRRHVSQAYPFGERAMHPYRMWLAEVKFVMSERKSEAFRRQIRDLPGQTRMFGGEG